MSEEESKQSCTTCPHSSPVLERRSFLKWILGLLALVWGGMTTYPIFRYLSAKSNSDTDVQVSSVSLGAVSAFPKGGGKNFQFGSQPALIIRDDAGNFKAYSAVCTHLGCTVQYGEEQKKIWCACHGGQYDPETGTNIAGPPPKPLTALKVEIIKDQVTVTKA